MPGRTRSSWLREVMPSLAKTLRKWYWTVCADEEPGADLGVREPVARQPGDLCFLGGQLVASLDGALAGGHASGPQLAARPLRERLRADPLEHAVSRAQLLARVAAAALPAQPFPVQQMGAGELDTHPGPAQVGERLAVEALGFLALAQQRLRPGPQPERPVGAAGIGHHGEPLAGAGRGLGHPAACRGLDQLDRGPDHGA
jgi:hypothetical protein